MEVGEYDMFMNDFHLCTLESAWSGLVSMSAVPGPLIDWFKFNRMQANPEKFQAIATGQRSAKELDSLTLYNVNIPCENEVKLLGATYRRMSEYRSIP